MTIKEKILVNAYANLVLAGQSPEIPEELKTMVEEEVARRKNQIF